MIGSICFGKASGKGRRSYEQRSASVRDLGRRRSRRGGLLGNAGPHARGDDQCRMDALRGPGILRHRLPLLRALHPGQGTGNRRFPGDTGRAAQQRSGLRADGPEGALRAPLCRNSRGGAASRTRFGRADGLLAGDDLDHRRRHTGRRRSGHDDALLLHAKKRQISGPDGERRDRTRRRSGSAHRCALDHGDTARRSRPCGGQRARGIPVGRFLARYDHPDSPADGCIFAFPASGAGSRGRAHWRRFPEPRHNRGGVGLRELPLALIVYGFVASVLPVWVLLAPRDYLSPFMKIGTMALLAVGIAITLPPMHMPRFTEFAFNGQGPVFAGSLFPFVFIIIACGALSGFHSLVASGTTPKLIQKESQVRPIGYGAMLTESFVAVMAMIAAVTLDPGVYFAMNANPALLGDTVQSASQAVNGFGFSVSP